MIDKIFLSETLSRFDLSCSDGLFEKLDLYAKMLVEWNEKMNLTAITDPEGIAIKHFADSLLFLKAADLPAGSSLIDVGTGAGFPSVPLALYTPVKLTLLDSLNKRINFLTELCGALSLPANCVHGRAEEVGRQKPYREKFDFATARAVAHLRELSEYCLPFVKVGGSFVALKGYDIETELEEAKYAISEMGGEVTKIEKFVLSEDAKRAIAVIKKVRPTPPKYPRISAKIKKSPLQK